MHATFQKKAKFNIYSVLLFFFLSSFLHSWRLKALLSCLRTFTEICAILYSKIRLKFFNTKVNFKFIVWIEEGNPDFYSNFGPRAKADSKQQSCH